uniref:BOS complex subunit TMEM147 n=1 Tax=Ursus americanus TaxID=9643 RepID=A0A452SGJ4_URSAM
MTLFHCWNGFTLAHFPYFITYKRCGLSTLPSRSVCRPGSPTSSCGCARCYSWPCFSHLGSVHVADLIGLNLLTSWNVHKGEYKIMLVALGWATGTLIVSHCIPSELELRALSLEVHQKSMDSSISLVHYIISSAQVWMITRYDLYHTFQPAFLLVMFLNIYEAFIMEIFVHLCSLGNWTAMYGGWVVSGSLQLGYLCVFCLARLVLTISSFNPPFFSCLSCIFLASCPW